VSWLSEFEDELTARAIRPAARERLVVELADHIACEQATPTRLGPPREIAGQYADELAADDIRHGAAAVFAALSCAALALVVSQLTLGRFVGYPGFDHGFSTPLALVAIFAILIGPQVALVGGTLAAWRALRRRREAVLPAAEIALVRRRAQVGLVAGVVTAAGLLLYTADFIGVLPAWWLGLSGGLAAVAMAALVAALRVLARSRATVVAAVGPAGDIFDDIKPLRALRGHPLLLWLSAALSCGGLVTIAEWHAEHSLDEGLQRGILEAVALSIGFAALGRTIGARR
jgi:MFS family permease